MFVTYTAMAEGNRDVSVSLRSIVHSYTNGGISLNASFLMFPSPYGVSFILILMKPIAYVSSKLVSFRLLTEYRSFL